MKKRHILTFSGFLLFLLGFVAIVVNLIGLPFALTDWTYAFLGPQFGFLIKLILIIAGIVITVVANMGNGDDKYDEYFDGDAFK